jgi:NAD(P)-dependent dehydrogenase (short-subunit alcohol dehydrogenase family)
LAWSQGRLVGDFTEIDRKRLEFTFKTNIIAMFQLAQLAVPHMKPGGSIINVSSIQAYSPSPGILDYAASKVGVCDVSVQDTPMVGGMVSEW